MTHSHSHSRRRAIIRISIWTVALLMLTNVFWAVWGSCDIDHPSILNQNVRLGTTSYSLSSGVVVREQRTVTRTTYDVGRSSPDEITSMYPRQSMLAFEAVAPIWIERRFSGLAPADGEAVASRAWFDSIGWPVRLFWCGVEQIAGARRDVPRSGIRMREPRKRKGRLDGMMPMRPILAGEVFYTGFWLAVVLTISTACGWLARRGWSRAELTRVTRLWIADARRGQWLNARTAIRVSGLLLLGLLVNLSLAWVCAAGTKPTGKVSIATLAPISDGWYEGESRVEGVGRSLIFRTPTREYAYLAEDLPILQEAKWEFDERSYAEIQAGWPMRAWSCRNYAYHEMMAYHGGPRTKQGTDATIGGIELAPFSLPAGLALSRAWRALPYRPIWTGAVLNTLLFASVAWLILFLPGLVRRMERRRLGRCVGCGYDLRGAVDGVCPECGAGCEVRV